MSTILLNSLNVSKSTNNSTTSQISGLTTLSGAIDASVTTIPLSSTVQYINSGTIKIDNEYITYTAINENTLTGCTRGLFQSTAVSHDTGASVYGVFVGIGDLNPQPNVACSMSSDQSGTLYFQYSNDGVTYGQFPSNGFNVSANITEFQTGVKLLRYFRIVFINLSSSKTTLFQAVTYYGTFGQPQIPLNQDISDDYTSIITRSVLTGQDPNNVFTNTKNMGYLFQTTDLLGANATYTTNVLTLSGYSQVQTEIYSNQDGTISGYWYSDSAGTKQIRQLNIPYTAAIGYTFLSAPVFAPYVKYSFTNTTNTIQTSFYFATKVLTQSISGQILNLTDTISSGMVANLGRNILVGETGGNKFVNVPVTNEGHLEVAIHGPTNAFGSVHSENLTPVSQSQGVYTYGSNQLNPNVFKAFTTQSALVDSSNNMISCSTSNTSNSIAQVTSREIVTYSPGQGLNAKFTALYSSGATNTTQQVGITNGQDLLAFGYNGANFGIFYQSFGVLPVWSFSITSITSSPISLTLNLNGVQYIISGLSVLSTTDAATQIVSYVDYLGWTVVPSGSTLSFQYSLPVVGTTFTVTNISGLTISSISNTVTGVEPLNNLFIPQTQWNKDTCDGNGKSGFNLNPLYGNVFAIDIQYLGFGTFTFSIEASFDNNSSSFILVHSINNPNTLQKPTLSIPSFNFLCSANNGSTTNGIVTRSGSFGLFIEGQIKNFGNRFTHSRSLNSVVSTTIIPLYSIYNNVLFNGKTNKKTIIINNINFALRINNAGGTLYIYKNAKLSGSNFTSYNSTYSCSLVDTSATAFVGGNPSNEKLLISYLLPDNSNTSDTLEDIYILPGEVLTFAGSTTSSTATLFAFSFNVREND